MATANTKIKSIKSFLKDYIFDDVAIYPKEKMNKTDFKIPTYPEYTKLITYNYTVDQLKRISRHYQQKIGGKKNDLIYRLYNYLKYSYYIIKIQKITRGHLFRVFLKIHGPAIQNKKCVNDKDFLTFQKLTEIPYQQFYSFKDKDNFIYGFDICTIYNMLKNNEYNKNPYNRNSLPKNIYNDIKIIVTMAKNLKIDLNVKLEINNSMTDEKKLELRAIEVFQKMDNMGYITDTNWVMRLSRQRSLRYLRELKDVWNFRAQIGPLTKSNICPNGTPFSGINISIISATKTDLFLKHTILNIIDKLVTAGINAESKSLGCMYALGAMTIVSSSAANSLPWLYESFMVTNITN